MCNMDKTSDSTVYNRVAKTTEVTEEKMICMVRYREGGHIIWTSDHVSLKKERENYVMIMYFTCHNILPQICLCCMHISVTVILHSRAGCSKAGP